MVEKGQGPGWWPDFFEPLRQATERAAEWFSPRSDAAKEGETYTINLELPGVKREDIDISARWMRRPLATPVPGDRVRPRAHRTGGAQS